MESNLAHQMCVSACICVCVCACLSHHFCLSIPRDSLQPENRGERGEEKKQANSPFLSNYKWQTCYQESVWHLTTHDNLSALCQYSVTDWRLSVCVCMCVRVCVCEHVDWQIKQEHQIKQCPAPWLWFPMTKQEVYGQYLTYLPPLSLFTALLVSHPPLYFHRFPPCLLPSLPSPSHTPYLLLAV